MAVDSASDYDLLALSAALGASLAETSPMPWGDAKATWRLRLTDGRDLVGRRFGPEVTGDAERVVASMTLAGAAGIPVPSVRLIEVAGASWLVTDHVAGPVGAGWLDSPSRARGLAAAMGRLRRQLLDIDRATASKLPAPTGKTRPVGSGATEAMAAAESTLSERRVEGVFVHGDFAPINVIVDGEGGIRALLDFEHARLGDPLEDVAWWCWVVRRHHPDAWRAAWPTFCEAAGVDGIADGMTIHALMLRELVRRATASREAQARDRWLARVAEAATWRP